MLAMKLMKWQCWYIPKSTLSFLTLPLVSEHIWHDPLTSVASKQETLYLSDWNSWIAFVSKWRGFDEFSKCGLLEKISPNCWGKWELNQSDASRCFEPECLQWNSTCYMHSSLGRPTENGFTDFDTTTITTCAVLNKPRNVFILSLVITY